jgi:uncharacterized protein (UPF0332 family)
MTGERLAKAERAIGAARLLLDAGDADFAVARAYYAMFYTAEALLASEGLRFSKHSGVQSAFGQRFAKSGVLDPKYHRWLLEASASRLEGDYGYEAEIDPAEVARTLEQAEEFLRAARDYLGQGDAPG